MINAPTTSQSFLEGQIRQVPEALLKMQHRSFPRSWQDGGSGTELEADHPQVHLPWRGSRPCPTTWTCPMSSRCSCKVRGGGGSWTSASSGSETGSGLKRDCRSGCTRPGRMRCPWEAQVGKTHLRKLIFLPQMLDSMIGALITARPSTWWKSSLRWLATT